MNRYSDIPIEWLNQKARPHLHNVLTARHLPPSEQLAVPPGFSGHDFVIYLLSIAAEIEHALMVQYLYSAYSLGGPQVPEAQRAAVLNWQNIILGIAKEEMGHFITVQNILRLIGGPLNFRREEFPWDSDLIAFPFTLEPLSRGAVAKYVIAESPTNWGSAATPVEKAEIEAQATENAGRPVKQVGVLYHYMITLLSDPRVIPDSAFLADTLPFQAGWDEWGRAYGGPTAASGQEQRPDLLVQTAYSRASAVAALQAVAEQGEAPIEDFESNQPSHFSKFLAVWKAYPAVAQPARLVAVNPIAPFDPDLLDVSSHRTKAALKEHAPVTPIANPATARWAILSNLRYRILLSYLIHTLSLSGPELAQPPKNARGLLVHSTFGEMYNLRALASMLVQLPAGPPTAELRAGPPFQMPYTISLPTGEEARWRLHNDLLVAAERLIESLLPSASGSQRAYLLAVRAADAKTLAAIGAMLESRRPHSTD
jgi:hypothetical protein